MENIDIGNFIAVPQEDGGFLYKAKIPRLKGDARYKDAPRLPLIFEYEADLKKKFRNHLKSTITNIVGKLKSFI